MNCITPDIAFALVLIIPCHGIFLSLFFFFRSSPGPTPNFFMGLLLLVLSLLTLFQISSHPCAGFPWQSHPYFFLYDLLTGPFLFLYNSVIIRAGAPARLHVHLPVIGLVCLLVPLAGFAMDPVIKSVTVIVCLVTEGLYFLGSARLCMGLMKKNEAGLKSARHLKFPGILVFNLLAALSVCLSLILAVTYPFNILISTLVSKGLVIYYLYFKVLLAACGHDWKTGQSFYSTP